MKTLQYHPDDLEPQTGRPLDDARTLDTLPIIRPARAKSLLTESGRKVYVSPSRATERETDWRKVEPSDSRFDIPFQRIAEVNGISPGTPEYRKCFEAWASAGKRRYEQIKRKEPFIRYTLEVNGAEYDADTYRPIEITEHDTQPTYESN